MGKVKESGCLGEGILATTSGLGQILDDDHGDLITQIQRELIQFYVDKEFGTKDNPKVRTRSVAKTPQKKVNQKTLKLVDVGAH